ncbi:MAG: hypothetical protein OXU64_13675 [Gemmatimonadota bacterium]|nr:hypothetical protein [Gemmatimonadota bacterium]
MSPAYEERSASQSEEALREYRDAWLIALLIGCTTIGFGNLIGIGPWWLASTVAAWMIIYGFFIARTVDDADVPSDTKGESIYYLGLLFTFAALVAALITFDWGAPGGDGSGTTGSIRNFGIALLTTIVGLAGRVWFTMSQESPGDIVDTTRSRLEETVALMKESLDRARDDLDIMAHKFRDSSAGLGEMAETIAEGTKRTAGIYAALDEYADHITAATRSLAREMDRLNAVCDAGGQALGTLQGRAEELGERLDNVQVRFARAEATFDGINKVAGPAAERIAATLRGVGGMDAAVSALGDTLSGVRGSAERAKVALTGIADAVDEHEVLPLWKEAVDQLHEGTRGIRGIGRHAAEMNAGFEGLGDSLRAARKGLASIPGTAGSLDEQLREMGPELADRVGPVRRLARELKADLAAAGERSAQLSSTLEEARREAGELSAHLREVSRVKRAVASAVARVRGIRRTLGRMPRALTRLPRFRRKS